MGVVEWERGSVICAQRNHEFAGRKSRGDSGSEVSIKHITPSNC